MQTCDETPFLPQPKMMAVSWSHQPMLHVNSHMPWSYLASIVHACDSQERDRTRLVRTASAVLWRSSGRQRERSQEPTASR